jgi:hypothetical protein
MEAMAASHFATVPQNANPQTYSVFLSRHGGIVDQPAIAKDVAFTCSEEFARSLDPAWLTEPPEIGRKRLPTTALGPLSHISRAHAKTRWPSH